MDPRARARELAARYAAAGDATGWFEHLYQETEQDSAAPPWVKHGPNPNLVGFWRNNPLATSSKSALVVGCGYGDDAEQLAEWGFATTAFDIAPSAILACRRRFPATRVEYLVGDLLHPPAAWTARFDFIFEAYTLQALPSNMRAQALQRLPELMAPGGHLLIVARGRDEKDPVGEMPWPLTRAELAKLTDAGLRELSFEDFEDHVESEPAPVRRFRILYQRHDR